MDADAGRGHREDGCGRPGVVRGDHDVNEAKLGKAAAENFGITSIALVDTPEVRQTWAIGFVAPDAAMKRLYRVLFELAETV